MHRVSLSSPLIRLFCRLSDRDARKREKIKFQRKVISRVFSAYFLGLLIRFQAKLFEFAGSKQLIRERLPETGTSENATERLVLSSLLSL